MFSYINSFVFNNLCVFQWIVDNGVRLIRVWHGSKKSRGKWNCLIRLRNLSDTDLRGGTPVSWISEFPFTGLLQFGNFRPDCSTYRPTVITLPPRRPKSSPRGQLYPFPNGKYLATIQIDIVSTCCFSVECSNNLKFCNNLHTIRFYVRFLPSA